MLQILKIIKQKIENFETIIIHGHKRPDGDCYGSQLGLKDIIETNYPNKKVYVVGENNPNLEFLGKIDQIKNESYENALVFIVDCGQMNVVSDIRFNLGKTNIRIDHHLSKKPFCELEWIDSSFGSCSEMIYHFKEQNNFQLTQKGALAIFTGILTDTGNFRFERTNSNTFRVASELLNYDLNVFEIEKKINKQKINLLKFQGYVCNHFKTEEGLIYFQFSEETIKKFNLNFEEAFSIVNILSNTENNPVWAFIANLKENEWKFSIRSVGPRIDHIAQKFGGGGHYRACGVFVKTEDDVKQLLILLKESIKEYLKNTPKETTSSFLKIS